jgi:hypothetical protein
MFTEAFLIGPNAPGTGKGPKGIAAQPATR